MTYRKQEAPVNTVPAAAGIQWGRALCLVIWRKGYVGGSKISLMLKIGILVIRK